MKSYEKNASEIQIYPVNAALLTYTKYSKISIHKTTECFFQTVGQSESWQGRTGQVV